MIDLLQVAAFNAAYVRAIDADALEEWPGFFTENCRYRITNVENDAEGLAAGIVWADSRAMLSDRVAALRKANIYERQRYRHILGIPFMVAAGADEATSETPFMVARIMHTGETDLFASGCYRDRFVLEDGNLRLAERVVLCDSTVIDTLLALPL